MSTHSWWKPVRALRRREGLGPGGSPLTEGKFSPHLVLALFSRGLAKAQPDWPASSVQPGFVFYDRGNEADRVTTDMRTFLASGEAPIVFTQGSTAVHNAGSFYEVSTEAVKRLGKRALLIGATPIPQFQDPSLFVAPYAPYSEVFANASVIVHQGGSGTTGQAMRAGVPTLIVPYGWDQPDNAVRIERAGAGLTIPRKRYTAESAADALARLISDPGYGRRAAELRAQIEAEDAHNGRLRRDREFAGSQARQRNAVEAFPTARLQPVSALPRMPRLPDDAVHRNVDDFNEPGPGELERAPRRVILRIARDPEWIDADAPRQRQQQPHSPRSIVVAAVVQQHVVTNVTRVERDVRRGSDAETDAAKLFLVAACTMRKS